ncbi:unnamed protein product [Haemonchus placei]|uniref:Phospholipid-transporting ATPase n=1 Tax=Haemonchus placei TaxID=6290 RepID=A0A158QLS6_HAEPC|nr:unnamed protein product [Haemonchus placei]
MFRKMYWKHILVGDFVHVSNEQEIPADVLFLRSSDENGTCYVETCNLDGETSLKQRLVPRHYLPFSQQGNDFTPPNFTGTVFCEPPDPAIYTIRAKIERAPGSFELITKDNMLLRGSRLRNTTFIEGIVLYAGHDTKVMMNNGRAPHKISGIELLTNRFIVLCMVILTAMVVGSSLMSGIWLGDHPLSDNDANVTISICRLELSQASHRRCLRYWLLHYLLPGECNDIVTCKTRKLLVIVPISLYITVEIIKIAQIFFLSQDIELYDSDMDRAIDCRSLNIPEELGQISHVLSDKTGTLTENIMIFRNCAFDHVDYGPDRSLSFGLKISLSILSSQGESDSTKPVVCVALQDRVKSDWPTNTHMKHFFLNMVLNNSVVVNKVPHHDALEVGFFERDVYNIGNSSFYDITAEQFKEMVEQFKSQTASTSVDRPQQIGSCLSEIPEDSEIDSTIGGFSTLPSPTTPNFDSDTVETPAPVSRVSSFSKFVKRNLISPIISPITSLLPYDSIRKRHETVVANDFCPYEAESPDELAIIMGASLYGFKLEDKSATHTIIGVPGGAQERFEVLQVFPFHAERKRMSVVVKTPSGPLLYCKGADSAILSRLRRPTKAESIHGSSLKERLDEYSCKGLRTLAFAMRLLDQEHWEEFLESYRFVMSISSNDRDQLLSQKADEIEKELELLGVTGIEDRLQDGVEETIVALREAGMQVWVLTGDKLETAENIARSCGLFAPRLVTWKIETREDLSSIRGDGYNLVLSPQATHLAKLGDEGLLTVLRRAKSVLCYRMTPSEKAEMVKCVKTHLKGRVLTIGDGANDVPMIQAAHVGIGIVGKEGMQAAMACDFAIVRFQFLRRLLLVHGHWCYDRLSLTFLYFLYKNTNNVFLLFFFQLYNGWSASFNTDPVYSILYPIIFSSLQPIVVGVIDQDASAEELLSNPVLYSPGRKGTKYTYQLFAINTIDGIWQAAVVFFTPFLTFTGQECGLWQFGFYIASGMMFTNTAHLAVEVRCWERAKCMAYPQAFSSSSNVLYLFVEKTINK